MDIWIVARNDAPLRRLGGRSLLGRILTTLRLAGVQRATLIVAADVPLDARDEIADAPLPCRVVAASAPAPDRAASVLVIEADRVYDPALLQALLGRPPGTRLCDGPATVGLAVVDGGRVDPRAPVLVALDRTLAAMPESERLQVDDLPRERPDLRRSLRPWWIHVRDDDSAREARRRLADAAGKGTMEWLVVVLNRPLERRISYHLAETSITPNQITVAGNLVAYVAAALLATGRVGAGLGLVLATQVLDGLDGRQARIQLRFSAAGKLEHFFDKLFEVAWMAALTWHLSAGGDHTGRVAAGVVWIASVVVANLAGSVYRDRRGVLPEQETLLDARIRFWGFRRNTSFAILFAGWLAGLLGPAFWLVVCGSAATAALLQVRTRILLRRAPATDSEGRRRR